MRLSISIDLSHLPFLLLFIHKVHRPPFDLSKYKMYTNTIIGSYNAIANSEHGAIIMKPPTAKRSHPHPPPKKSHSREAPSASSTPTQRSHSEESGGHSRVTSPEASRPPPVPAILPPNTLPGLELLLPHTSVQITPDSVFSPEVRKMGFTVDSVDGVGIGGGDEEEGQMAREPIPLLKCLPSDNASSRFLLIQTIEGRTLLTVNTPTPYCCSWYKTIEAKVVRPEGTPFGLIEKRAFGPCLCSRNFRIGLEGEEEPLQVEVVLSPAPHFVIKMTSESQDIVGRVTSLRIGLRSAYKVTFSRPDIPPNVKAIVIVFAIILHIAYAEKLNTCMGMCLCCCAGISVAAWILCLV